MVQKLIIALVILIILFIGGAVYFLGMFDKFKITEKKVGPYILIYEEHLGPYQEVGEIQNRIYYSLLNEEKIETVKGFGIYYDNPAHVEPQKLRSIAGCILEQPDYKHLEKLKQKYNIKEFPEQQAVVSQIPFRNNLSIIMGIIRVYPAIKKYIKKKQYQFNEMMEIYDNPNKKIIYVHVL